MGRCRKIVDRNFNDKLEAITGGMRDDLLANLSLYARDGKVDELKKVISDFVEKNGSGYLPCELAIALQMVTDIVLTMNFDFQKPR